MSGKLELEGLLQEFEVLQEITHTKSMWSGVSCLERQWEKACVAFSDRGLELTTHTTKGDPA